MRYRRPLTVLLIEVDFEHFSPGQNVKWGMAYTIYKQLGPLFMRQLRKVDLAARMGGEQFALLLPETGLAGAQIAGERIRKAVETHEFIGEDVSSRVRVAINVGMATFPDHGTGSDELMATAQKALLLARRDGGNLALVYPERLHDPEVVFRTLAPPNAAAGSPSPARAEPD